MVVGREREGGEGVGLKAAAARSKQAWAESRWFYSTVWHVVAIVVVVVVVVAVAVVVVVVRPACSYSTSVPEEQHTYDI